MTQSEPGLTARFRDLERRFRSEEEQWAKAGSGMTKEQMTGAAMVWSWLSSPQGGGLHLADVERALAAQSPVQPVLSDPMLGTIRDGRHPEHDCGMTPCPHIPVQPVLSGLDEAWDEALAMADQQEMWIAEHVQGRIVGGSIRANIERLRARLATAPAADEGPDR